MQRDIIRFEQNVPVIVKLDFGPEGIERKGKYGLEYQYTCNDDACVFWVPPSCRQSLLKSGAQAGDEVQITKRKRGSVMIFDAQLVGDAAEAPAQARADQPPPPRLPAQSNRRGSIPPSKYATAQPHREASANANVRQQQHWEDDPTNNGYPSNGDQNGHGLPVSPSVQKNGPPRTAANRGNSHMAQALCAGVDAALEAMAYAREKGLGLQFSEEQIQDIGVTIYIQDCRREERQ